METKKFYFAKVETIVRPGIINLNMSIYENAHGSFTLSIEGDAKDHYIREAGLDDRKMILRFETCEEAMQYVKMIAEKAKQDGYFQTHIELSTFDMNALMAYKHIEEVKSLLLYNINND